MKVLRNYKNLKYGQALGKFAFLVIWTTKQEIHMNFRLSPLTEVFILLYSYYSTLSYVKKMSHKGGLSTTAMVKIQLTDVNDNRPTFYPREYNVSLRETDTSLASTPVVVVVATDPDNGRYGSVSYRIIAGNEAGIFRVDRITGEIFVTRPNMLSNRNTPYYRLNISASDGGGLRTTQDAEIFISIIDSAQRPPIFEKARYNYYVKEDVNRGTVVGSVLASSRDTGKQ